MKQKQRDRAGAGRHAGRSGPGNAASARRPVARAPRREFWDTDLFRGALLVVITLMAYGPVFGATWIWDDNRYITQNPRLLDWGGLALIWFHPHENVQYYPIVFTIFWIEHHIWGADPFIYHFVNIVLHVANSVLLWRILRRSGVPGAWGAGLLFALHPVHVESVAWATELKDVLSGFFALAALWYWDAGAGEGEGSGAPRSGGAHSAWLFIACSALAIVTKPVVCPLVVVLPLWSWWRRGRVARREWVLLVPAFLVALGMGLIHLSVEQQNMSKDPAAYGAEGLAKLLVAGRAFWFYLGKLAWPWPLMTFYPRWELDTSSVLQWVPVLAALALLAVLWRARRTLGRGPLAALAGFGLMLAPALGFAKGGFFRFSFVSDHFQYLASIGPLALAVAAVAQARDQAMRAMDRVRLRRILRLAPAAAMLALAGLTAYQGTTYFDGESLWSHNSEFNQVSSYPHEALGMQLLLKGHLDEAVASYRVALGLDPNLPLSWFGLGEIARHQNRLEEAVDDYRHALALQKGKERVPALDGLGVALGKLGRTDESLTILREAIGLEPEDALAHDSIGVALSTQSKFKEAESEFAAALALRPTFTEARQHLAAVRQKLATDAQLKSAGLAGIGPGGTVNIPIAGRGATPSGGAGSGPGRGPNTARGTSRTP